MICSECVVDVRATTFSPQSAQKECSQSYAEEMQELLRVRAVILMWGECVFDVRATNFLPPSAQKECSQSYAEEMQELLRTRAVI